MTDLPTIAILFLTKEVPGREGIAVATIEEAEKYLTYEGACYWVICDGGSSSSYIKPLQEEIAYALAFIHSNNDSPGRNWNKSIQEIFNLHSIPIYLRLEDDFALKDRLDITPYVKLLMEREDVGMVRLGLMPINLDLYSVAHDGRIYFDVQKTTSYAYSGNPALIHKRMHDAYGYFHETMNPGEIEVEFDNRIRAMEGPRIWMPAELCQHTYGFFNHIGTVKSYE